MLSAISGGGRTDSVCMNLEKEHEDLVIGP